MPKHIIAAVRPVRRLALAVGAAALLGLAAAGPADAQVRQITAQQAGVVGMTMPPATLALDVWTNRADGQYLPGEELELYIRADADVRVAILNVDAMGRTNVLLPNAFATDSQLSGNTVHRVPAVGATYRFAVSEPFGTNLIKVVASTGAHPILDQGAIRAGSGPFPEVTDGAEGLVRAVQAVMAAHPQSAWASQDVFIDVVPQRAAAAAPVAAGFGLSLSLDKPFYGPGDSVTATLTAERDCTLTLVNINEAINQAVVLYPNQAVASVRLRAGQTVTLPGADSPVRLAVTGPAGAQTMVATCTEEDRSLLGDLSAWPLRAIHPVLTTAQWQQIVQPPGTARATLRFVVTP